jgi:hypothetical protein
MPPDIVLADIGMPSPDGYDVARHVRQTPRLSHIPVLLMTSAFEPVDPRRVSEVGCHGVLAKPFEPQAVVQRVRDLLGRPSAPSPVVAPEQSVSQARPSSPAAVEQYFAQLDEAFARLTVRPKGLPPPSHEPPVPSPPQPAPPVIAPAARSDPSTAVPLAEAFAALLAAERTGTTPTGPSAMPSAFSPAGQAGGAVPDAVIEEVVRRVLDRLPDRVVRDTVGEIVREVAERLVQEEIARIRATIL